MKTVLKHCIAQLEEIQEGKPWIGSSYTSKLKNIHEQWLFVRPMEGMHSIAEIFSHCTLWRKEAILKINTGKGSKTDDCEENWLSNTQLKAMGWATINMEYKTSLAKLIEVLEQKEDKFLDETYYDTDFKDTYPYRFLINGMLHHDIYHLGQLGIILKYLKKHSPITPPQP